MTPLRTRIAVGFSLMAVTLAAYWPVTGFEFVNLDDPDYVTANPFVARGLTWSGLLWAFQASHAGNWHPLTWLSHMLDVQMFGLNAGPHHLVNLLFHLANTVLLFLLFQRMTGAMWRSAFVAGIFALHPLHVESVAWVAERKDVLSTFFGLLSIWAYVSYVKAEGGSRKPVSRFTFHVSRFYLLSLLLFALSLMSKPMLVTLPFLLLLLDYWPLQRLALPSAGARVQGSTVLRLLMEKAPFLVLSALSSAITLFAQNRGGALATLENTPIAQRFAGASLAYVTYLGKGPLAKSSGHVLPFCPRLAGRRYPLRKPLAVGLVCGSSPVGASPILVHCGLVLVSRHPHPGHRPR